RWIRRTAPTRADATAVRDECRGAPSPASGNARDNPVAQPALPVELREVGGVDIDLDRPAHGADILPSDAARRAANPPRQETADAPEFRAPAQLDPPHNRRTVRAQLGDNTVDPADVAFVAVHDFAVEKIAHEVHHDPPKISNGIETTASAEANSVIAKTTPLPNQPFV